MTPSEIRNKPLKFPIRIGIIGMGGFAASHHEAIKALENDHQCQLICTCDPNLEAHRDHSVGWDFISRGVQVFDDYRKMLGAHASNLDLVTIPTPVPLHAVMHQACMETGLAVYLEKPPTLDLDELASMIESANRAQHQTNVGFNFIIEKPRRSLKQRLVEGEFGTLKQVRFCGLWPRARTYFTRASWAGRLMLDDRLVLDSCLANAMAHYIHNVLYWAGYEELDHWATPMSVKAEMYRVHDIEGADTIFAKALTENRVEVRLALSHACSGEQRHHEQLICEKATITYTTFDRYHISWRDAPHEINRVSAVSLQDNLAAHLSYLASNASARRPSTSLSDSRPFVILNALAYLAAASIHQIPQSFVLVAPTADGASEYLSIKGIDEISRRMMESGALPSEQSVAWASAGPGSTMSDLPKLNETVRNIRIGS